MSDIDQYIKQQLDAGASERDITRQLVATGWSQTHVNEAFIRIRGDKPFPKKPSPFVAHKKIFIGVGVGIFTLIVALAFLGPNSGGSNITVNETQESEETQSFSALATSRRDTHRLNDISRVIAHAENYATNNNGIYPHHLDNIDEFLEEYVHFEEELKDPLTEEKYEFVQFKPKLGELRYLASANCAEDGQNIELVQDTQNIIASVLLESGEYACIDTQ